MNSKKVKVNKMIPYIAYEVIGGTGESYQTGHVVCYRKTRLQAEDAALGVGSWGGKGDIKEVLLIDINDKTYKVKELNEKLLRQ